MAVAQGYGKTVTSGSVFAYDVADTRNSYRGEPTVNGVGNLNSYNPLDLYTWAPNGNTSTWARDTSVTSPLGGIPLKEISSGTDSYSDTYNGSADNIIAASSGQTWTVSVYALAAAGTNIQVWIFEANSSGNYIEADYNGFTATGAWQRISVTRTFSNGSTAYIQARVATATNGGVIWWDGLQVEQKSYPTQFVNGTRSATQGLLPLVGNSTLDLSNVSFDSSAKMVFDGTDDYIEFPTINLSGDFTIAQVANLSATANGPMPIGGGYYANGSTYQGYMWFRTNNNQIRLAVNGELVVVFSVLDSLWVGKTIYYAVKRQGTTATLYIDGIEVGSGTISTNNFDIRTVGYSYHPAYASQGNIPITKIYNRALTAQEVRQNYQQYKTRFNLS